MERNHSSALSSVDEFVYLNVSINNQKGKYLAEQNTCVTSGFGFQPSLAFVTRTAVLSDYLIDNNDARIHRAVSVYIQRVRARVSSQQRRRKLQPSNFSLSKLIEIAGMTEEQVCIQHKSHDLDQSTAVKPPTRLHQPSSSSTHHQIANTWSPPSLSNYHNPSFPNS